MKAMVRFEMDGVAYSVSDMETVENFVNEMVKLAKAYNREMKANYWEAGFVPFEELPEDVKAEAMNILKAYNEVSVVYEYGKFHASAGVSIKASYNFDHCVCGYYKAEDLYTKEERRQNFFESFGYYPAFLR